MAICLSRFLATSVRIISARPAHCRCGKVRIPFISSYSISSSFHAAIMSAATAPTPATLTQDQQSRFKSLTKEFAGLSYAEYLKGVESKLTSESDRKAYSAWRASQAAEKSQSYLQQASPKPEDISLVTRSIDFKKPTSTASLVKFIYGNPNRISVPLGSLPSGTSKIYLQIELDTNALSPLPDYYWTSKLEPLNKTTSTSSISKPPSSTEADNCSLVGFGDHPDAKKLPQYGFVLGSILSSDKIDGEYESTGFAAVVDAEKSNIWAIVGPGEISPDIVAATSFPGIAEKTTALNFGVSLSQLPNNAPLKSSGSIFFEKVPYAVPLDQKEWELFKNTKSVPVAAAAGA